MKCHSLEEYVSYAISDLLSWVLNFSSKAGMEVPELLVRIQTFKAMKKEGSCNDDPEYEAGVHLIIEADADKELDYEDITIAQLYIKDVWPPLKRELPFGGKWATYMNGEYPLWSVSGYLNVEKYDLGFFDERRKYTWKYKFSTPNEWTLEVIS